MGPRLASLGEIQTGLRLTEASTGLDSTSLVPGFGRAGHALTGAAAEPMGPNHLGIYLLGWFLCGADLPGRWIAMEK